LALKTAAPDRFDCPGAIAGHGRPDPAAIYAAPGVFGEPRADVDLYGAGTLALGPKRAQAVLEQLLA
jgi:hypothetical protein